MPPPGLLNTKLGLSNPEPGLLNASTAVAPERGRPEWARAPAAAARIVASTMRPVLARPLGLAGFVCVTLILVCALFSPVLAPYDPIAIAPHLRLEAPGWAHPFGTDQLGRDVFSRVLAGSSTVMGLVGSSIAVSLVLGVAGGLAAGYGPRLLGGAIMLLCDVVMTLPMMLCALAIATVLGSGLATVGIVVTLFLAPAYARVVRAQSLVLVRLDYVTAARALGAGPLRVMLRHLLPNMAGQLLVQVAMDVPTVIGTEVGMTFLGQGADPPDPSWGSIVSDGYSYVRLAPHIVLAGSLPIVVATIGFTFLAEALRDVLDPKRITLRSRNSGGTP